LEIFSGFAYDIIAVALSHKYFFIIL